MPTAMAVSSMCSMRRGWNVLLQWLENHSQQNWRFSRAVRSPLERRDDRSTALRDRERGLGE
jgi:hypothetical protein